MPEPNRTATATLRAPDDRALGADAVGELRRFHRLGEASRPAAAATRVPPALAGFRGAEVRTDYPLFLAAGDAGEVVCRPLPALLAELAPPESRALTDNLVRLERRVRRGIADAGRPLPAAPLLAEAAAAVAAELGLPTSEAAGFDEASATLQAALPVGGVFVPFDAAAPLTLLAAAATAHRDATRTGFVAEARALADAVDALLAADAVVREGRQGAAIETSLGALGGRYVRASALAEVGDGRHGGTALDPARRDALVAARSALAAFCEPPPPPRLFVADPQLAATEDWATTVDDDPTTAATVAWDEEVERLLAVIRALHRGRLEMAGNFDPLRHEAWLEHLGWEDLGADEIALATPIAVVVGPDALLAGALPALSRLLLSGRPVQVVVPVEPGRLDGPQGRGGLRFEPAFLGVAHREVFVQQGSVARPEALLDGFRRALGGTRAGLHVVAVAPDATAGLDPWLLAAAAVEGRAHPLFVYDPAAGLSWARRLDFRANPEPEADWVSHTVAVGDDAATASELRIPFTAADLLLLADPTAARPVVGSADELLPLDEWLALDATAASHRLPFVWASDESGRLERLLVTRRLALVCRDRLAFWHLLQELGGVRNEHVEEARRAAAETAGEAAADERRRLEEEHASELEKVRTAAAEEAVDRLVAALYELEAGDLDAAAGGSLAALGLPDDLDELTAVLLAAAQRPAGEGGAGEEEPDPRLASLAGELRALAESVEVPTRGAER